MTEHVDPRSITCPNCNAQPGKPCTQPTDDGRVIVSWHHLAREQSAAMPPLKRKLL